jgi:hypothetical protein
MDIIKKLGLQHYKAIIMWKDQNWGSMSVKGAKQ